MDTADYVRLALNALRSDRYVTRTFGDDLRHIEAALARATKAPEASGADAFANAMRGCQYGEGQTANARHWFMAGYNARINPAPPTSGGEDYGAEMDKIAASLFAASEPGLAVSSEMLAEMLDTPADESGAVVP